MIFTTAAAKNANVFHSRKQSKWCSTAAAAANRWYTSRTKTWLRSYQSRSKFCVRNWASKVAAGLPNREQAIQILEQQNCPPQVINHCLAVTTLALEIAAELKAQSIQIDLALVEAGAILHDLGRAKSHEVDHGLVGAQMAKSLGLPQRL